MTKINTERFMELLAEKLGVSEYIGVPCSNLKYLINNAVNRGQYITAPNEGEAVAYAAGSHFAGKKVAVMMQNSGFANSLNVITSLSCIYKVPQLYLIGYRGMHGTGTDEPQHEVMGHVTEKWLSDCGIMPIVVSTFLKENETEEDLVKFLVEASNGTRSIALLFDKKDCSPVSLETTFTYSNSYTLSRNEVIESIANMRKYNDKLIIIATTGYTGRDLYDHFDNPKNFYMVGSMGCALSLACGIAKNKPDYRVIVIDGDGAVKMRPQGGILAEELALPNLLHIILDNSKYESTGGQLTSTYPVFKISKGVRDNKVVLVSDSGLLEFLVSGFCKRVPLCHEDHDIRYDINTLVVRINSDKNNNELGRPKETSVELATRFMEAIK